MKKIGILTYHNAINYGAVFQAYALQQYLLDMGYDAYIINYKNTSIEEQYRLKSLLNNQNIITDLKWDIQQMAYLPAKKRNFRIWEKKYRLLDVADRESLKSIADNLDKVIVGSDQVWKLKAHNYDTTYFLDFAEEKKRISYAASFGASELSDQDRAFVSKYLNKIPSISVREESGVDLVRKLTGRKAEHVLDPVLLMDRDFWVSNMSERKIEPSREYIFVYQLGTGNYLSQFAQKMANNMKLKILYVTDYLSTMLNYGLVADNKSSIDPSGFLRLLYGARMVCTNSFHATALSLIMQKDFYTIIKGNEKDLWNTRLYSLLKLFNLEERLVHVGEPYKSFYPCAFDNISEKMNEYRKNSRMFLQQSIVGDEYAT